MGSCTCAASKHKTVPRTSDNLLVLTNYWDQTPGNEFISWSVSSTCSFSNVQWACCWCLIWKITLRWSSIQIMWFWYLLQWWWCLPKAPKVIRNNSVLLAAFLGRLLLYRTSNVYLNEVWMSFLADWTCRKWWKAANYAWLEHEQIRSCSSGNWLWHKYSSKYAEVF